MFRKEDIEQIEQRGSSVKTVEEQVERFKKGFPWLKIVAPATPERGIQVLDEAAVEAAASYYDNATMNGKCKFVPASGAASRMFKAIPFSFKNSTRYSLLKAFLPGRRKCSLSPKKSKPKMRHMSFCRFG